MLYIIIEAAVRSLVLGLIVWLGLEALRVRNPHLEMTAWAVVLLMALAMPLLQTYVRIATPELPWLTLEPLTPVLVATPRASIPWGKVAAVAAELYALVALVLLVRCLVGTVRVLRLRHTALVETALSSIAAADVRLSERVTTPVSVGSSILLPRDAHDWDDTTRTAVLAHERAHVANRDFHLQLLARLHRAIFWFSPLAWWLPARLTMLSEQVSDDAAIAAIGDRARYAEILLRFAAAPGANREAVAMARAKTVAARVERALSQEELAAPVDVRRRVTIAALLAPLAMGVAACNREEARAPTMAAASPQTRVPASIKPGAVDPDARPVGNTSPVEPAPDGAMLPKSSRDAPFSQPRYPSVSRKTGETGTVVMLLHVLEDGSIDDVRIKKSSGHLRLDYSAASEALNWRAQPGVVNGRPAAMWGQFAVTFKLQD